MYYLFATLVISLACASNIVEIDKRDDSDFFSVLYGINVISDYWNKFSGLFQAAAPRPAQEFELSQDMIEDTYLNATGLARKYGYIIEEHNVITDDGYILTIHRLSSPNVTKNGEVFFLMHGIIDSSDGWLLQGPNFALAYLLVDRGFDVWLGNARGNWYSESHLTLTSKVDEYWDFSWEEIGIYDLPVMIDFVLDNSNAKQLYYVGHSQGTTAFFVMTAMKPEYNSKIKIMYALSPVAFMTKAVSPILKFLSPDYPFVYNILSRFKSLAPSTDLFKRLFSRVCYTFISGCENIAFMIVGDNIQMPTTLIPQILGHLPSGSSTKQVLHYGQLVHNNRFARYDYGLSKNLEKYGRETPPDYDLNKVMAPVVMYYSDRDWLSNEIDVLKLKDALPNVYRINKLLNFSHLDFVYAHAAKIIYLEIIEEVETEENFI